MLFNNINNILYYGYTDSKAQGFYHKQRTKARRKRLEKLIEEFKCLLEVTGPKFDILKKDITHFGELKPQHYAYLVYHTSIMKRCLRYAKTILMANKSTKEVNYFIIKTILALKTYLHVEDLNQLLDWWYENCTPGSAMLMQYYFPELISPERQQKINYLICEFEHDMEKIETIIQDFEEYSKTFLVEFQSIITKR